MYEPKATGRNQVVFNEIVSCLLITICPVSMLFYLITFQDFGASLLLSSATLLSEGPSFFTSRFPRFTKASIVIYLSWVAVQAALYISLPGSLHKAPRTHGGRQLLYKLNGLSAWFVTVGGAVILSYFRVIDPTFIAEHWGGLLAAANFYCVALISIFYIKAHIMPDTESETLITGHFWYDLFNGGELHPRTGKLFDWKHFNASRTGGLLLWTLIDLSFAALQYYRHGVVTNSMVLAVAFRMVITVEYFYTENWFFETLDGAHERFSFYSIYGFAAIMPQIWTLQTQYLTIYPIHLAQSRVIAISLAFAMGWALNHLANNQKSTSRKTHGKCTIWGKDADYIEAKYKTADGKMHHTILLCSGWWGIVRHANYVGSLLYTWASCFTCSNNHLFPYTEAIMVTLTVIHRCWRDEAKCKEKYGEKWDEYCRVVKWRMIPGIF
ncbi:7-dehydrocholesterol reductase [Orbilia oligospora]|nr:7-dehydrocholesterol reductase [Orbilia oligospora]KAF3131548.1 7-dehydrocholesterol reductase [Orbilia oligospora]KAF3152303.1 7-dehydrocholesterol reductase [Orbilia oligospora]